MPIYDVSRGSSLPERRSSARMRLTAQVEVHLPSGVRQGLLHDLSENGAMIALDNPPANGATVKLRWGTHEVYGWVMWSDAKGCGLKFARSIPQSVVLEMGGQDADSPAATPAATPAADHANIPLGRKRRRLA